MLGISVKQIFHSAAVSVFWTGAISMLNISPTTILCAELEF